MPRPPDGRRRSNRFAARPAPEGALRDTQEPAPLRLAVGLHQSQSLMAWRQFEIGRKRSDIAPSGSRCVPGRYSAMVSRALARCPVLARHQNHTESNSSPASFTPCTIFPDCALVLSNGELPDLPPMPLLREEERRRALGLSPNRPSPLSVEFPRTRYDDWCGEFFRREEERRELWDYPRTGDEKSQHGRQRRPRLGPQRGPALTPGSSISAVPGIFENGRRLETIRKAPLIRQVASR